MTVPFYETMTRCENVLLDLTVRVWRNAPSWTRGPDDDVIDICERANSEQELLSNLQQLPGIAAIEILNQNGDGGLIYLDW